MNLAARRTERVFSRIPLKSLETDLQCIPIDIAGLRIDLLVPSGRVRQFCRHYFAQYAGSGAAPIRVILTEDDVVNARDWEDDDAEFNLLPCGVVQRDFAARVIDSATARALLGPVHSDAVLNLLRWLCPHYLLERRAFLLHSASIIHEGKGYVFFGQSGAGKSTTVNLLAAAYPDITVLGDDAAIIAWGDGEGPMLSSAPLGSGQTTEPPPPLKAPLAGLFALRQAPRHGLQKLSVSQGTAALLASAMSADHGGDLTRKFDLAQAFAAGPGIAELSFAKDPGFWPLILEGRNHGK